MVFGNEVFTTWSKLQLSLIAVIVLHLTADTTVSGASIPFNLPLQEKHYHLLSKLSNYEVVRPYRSTPDGGFLSHDLSTSKEEEKAVYERAKRDTLLNRDGRSRYRRSALNDDNLGVKHHFRVDAFGVQIRLNVTRNRFIVTPKMKVELYKEDGTKEVYRPNTLCFYSGGVDDSPGSSVAISNCDGLSGFIKTGDEEFIIEPLVSTIGQSKANISDGHLHIIYRTKDFTLESTKLMTDLTFDLHHDTPERNISQQKPFSSSERQRRRAGDPGQKHFVETLLTADYSMTSFHGIDSVPTYLLTLLTIVNMAYHHDSMLTDIQFAASRIILLSSEQSASMVVERQAQASLAHICRWSSTQTVRAENQANHHDLAVFITRLDFGPAGYAPVTGMCDMRRSCALARDEGLLSSFVVAHEAGHVFGMEHDGTGNSCTDDPYLGSIMAPVVISTYNNHFWSECSNDELNRYLRAYICLEDTPFESGLPELDGYPGEWYNMNDQCKFDFGEEFELCGTPEESKSCHQLWCIDPWDPQYCRTKKGPALDGSHCGDDKWCIQGVCVYRDMGRQNGEWNKWSQWSDCSYPCDVGVEVRIRKCDNPAPSHGGKDCKGESYEYRLCNVKACVGDLEDRRAKQCEDNLASFTHRATTHSWLPFENRNKTLQCRLTCISEKTDDVVVTEYNVTDGTPCSYDDHHSICVQGQCVKLGCDKVVDSSKVEDRCGICEGDNSLCNFIQKHFYSEPKKKYQQIGVLPAGARYIDVKENTQTDSFVALRTADKSYILNARSTQSGPHSFIEGRARFVYAPDDDRLFSVGPLQAHLDLLVFWKKNSKPVNITYGYYVQKADSTITDQTASPPLLPRLTVTDPPPPVPKPEVEYIWQDLGWTQCTQSCGGGSSFHSFQCIKSSDDSRVKKTFCGQGSYNPKATKKPCNEQSCDETIFETEATPAPSVTTQMPQPATTKPITTTQPATTTTQTTTQPPTTTQQTTTQPATTTQQTTTQPATTTQQTTTQPATTTQQTTTQPATTTQQTTTQPPTTTQSQTTTKMTTADPPTTPTVPKKPSGGKKKPVFKWQVDEWNPCSHTCGSNGVQSRGVRCIKKNGRKVSSTAAERCIEEKPVNRQDCNREPCPAFWSIGDWSSCTVTCGDGFLSRTVLCGAPTDNLEEFNCFDERPMDTDTCNLGECPVEENVCTPLQSVICNPDSFRTYCNMPNYSDVCCTTCEEQEQNQQQKEEENPVGDTEGKKKKKKKKKKKGHGRSGRRHL